MYEFDLGAGVFQPKMYYFCIGPQARPAPTTLGFHGLMWEFVSNLRFDHRTEGFRPVTAGNGPKSCAPPRNDDFGNREMYNLYRTLVPAALLCTSFSSDIPFKMAENVLLNIGHRGQISSKMYDFCIGPHTAYAGVLYVYSIRQNLGYILK